jgi:hypothetical protein
LFFFQAAQKNNAPTQLDGGPNMSDSSSEDDEEEDGDTLNRYAGLQDEKAGDGEVIFVHSSEKLIFN